MVLSDDDDPEPQLNAVSNYSLVDGDNKSVSLSVLPIKFKDTDEPPECEENVFLRGTADPCIQVYKRVVAWKLGLQGRQPDVAVLSEDGSWINLTKPKNSYQESIRATFMTMETLHFLRRNPEEPEKNLWNHLRKVSGKFDVKPSEDDFRGHRSLMKQFAEKDLTLAKSEILRAFIEERSTRKNSEIGSDNVEVKESFIVDDEDIEDRVDDDNIESDEEEDDDLFDATCAICDDGGDLLCCDGPCMRSFHAKIGTGEDSYCVTLEYTEAEVQAMKTFLCKNCEYKQHQCFVCGALEPSDGPTAKVFLCNNATCGYFYHPKCVAQRLHPNNKSEASELENKITGGLSFTCPIHRCFHCKGLEDRTQEDLQFAVCRRCPKSYHRKCLPREIPFEDSEADEDIITRAWDLPKGILIYCLDHEIDSDLETPTRNHIKFPHIPKIVKPSNFLKKKPNMSIKTKKRTFDESFLDQPSNSPAKSPDVVRVQENVHPTKLNVKGSPEPLADNPGKKKTKLMKERPHREPNMVKDASKSIPKPAKEHEEQLAGSPSSTGRKMPKSSYPKVDSETEKRVIALVENEVSSLTLKDISRKCRVPSTHVYSGRQIDRMIATGKLEGSVQAVEAALKMMRSGGNVDDAKAVCEPQVLRQLARWHSKLRVYISPFIHGSRYSSFGRHFTKVEKLVEIVDKLHWYVEPGDTIVDFCCGANDFSRLMKEKLDQVQKKCHFKNYDLIQPQNHFCFERRDWMSVQPNELPRGSQLIMGLNPPFGVKAALANKFIDKALTFKPKLIILIIPKETKRLDQKKTPYDLVWEDSCCLAGKSFYLPGSVDVNDKLVEGWNTSVPLLYLWSRRDWTKKHKKVAEEHDHTTMTCHIEEGNLEEDILEEKEAESSLIRNSGPGKVIENTAKASCHRKAANLPDDPPVRQQAKATNKQNIRSGNVRETREKASCNVREVGTSEDHPVRKKQARLGEGKTEEADRSDKYPVKKEAEATVQQVSQSGKENGKDGRKSSDSHDRSRKRTPDQVDSLPPEKQVEVAYEEKRVIPSIRKEEQRDAHREESTGRDSHMSSDNSHARNRSSSYSPFKPTEHPKSDRTTHPDGHTSYPVKEPDVSTFKSSYSARGDGYSGDSSKKYSSSIEELTKRHADAPAGSVYSLQSQGDDSFYRRQSSQEWNTNVDRNSIADISRQGHYSGYLQTNQYSLSSSGARYGQSALSSSSYALSGSTAPRSLVMDKYSPALMAPSGAGGSVMDKYAPDLMGQGGAGGSVMDKYAPSLMGPSGTVGLDMDKYAAPGHLGPSAQRSSVMDRYALPLEGTNYTRRGDLDLPGYGSDPMTLAPRQHPYQGPGSYGRG